jgi:3-hydroxyisobutyrate dehydrogenase-like beta-hydroxyacid dehydrogenase
MINKIGFLGTGLMGSPMACRLLQHGLPVTVWNRSREKTAACVAHGATRADSPGLAIVDAVVVVCMLESGPVVLDVLEQALSRLRPGALVIDMSSTRPAEALAAKALLASRDVTFIDAPVSGGVIGAEAGNLAIMVGAAPEDFERALPVLSMLGQATRVGPTGTGQLAKLCNQLIVGGTINLVAEALLLAQAGGADPNALRVALRGGFADSKILQNHGQRMLERNFMPGGQVKSQSKDHDNVLTTAQALNVHLPQTEMIAAVYRRLMQTDPKADHSAAILDLERLNPDWRLGTVPDRKPD